MDEALSRASDIHAIGYFGVLIAVLLVESVIQHRQRDVAEPTHR